MTSMQKMQKIDTHIVRCLCTKQIFTVCNHSPMALIKIVGTTQFSQACSCEAHHICGAVVTVGIAVCLYKAQAMTVGEEQTRVSFLGEQWHQQMFSWLRSQPPEQGC